MFKLLYQKYAKYQYVEEYRQSLEWTAKRVEYYSFSVSEV